MELKQPGHGSQRGERLVYLVRNHQCRDWLRPVQSTITVIYIGTAIWMDTSGVKFADLELVTLAVQDQAQGNRGG